MTADDAAGLPVTFRPVVTRAVLLTTGTALLATFTAVALAMPGWTALDRSLLIATGALIFAAVWIFSRPRIVADAAGVTVVNLVSTRRLAWPQVLGVNLRPGDPWVYLDLADGTSLAAMGIQPSNGRRRAIREAERLRALTETHGTYGAAPAGGRE